MVYIIGQNGQPLMPTNRHGKVKHLLKDGKAKVISKCPFTIKLLYSSTNYTQKLTLGVDTGSGTLGTAVSTDDDKIVYMSKVIVRNDITNKMVQRSKYRRGRRNRKTRYRKPRFLNRKNSIKDNRFSPTMTSKIQSHKREIEFIKSILPITITGRMNTGYAILMDVEGNKVDFSSMPKGMKIPKLNNCIRVSARNSVLIDKVAV